MEIQHSKSKETTEFINVLINLSSLIKKAFNIRTLHLKGEKYLTNSEVCKFLHISQRTLQEYRDSRKISYIQISGKILYKESDILKLLERHYIPKK